MLEGMAVEQKNFIRFADGRLGTGFVFATLLGLEAQYPEMALDAKLNPAGRALADATGSRVRWRISVCRRWSR